MDAFSDHLDRNRLLFSGLENYLGALKVCPKAQAATKGFDAMGQTPNAPNYFFFIFSGIISFHPETLLFPDAETGSFQFGNEQFFLLEVKQLLGGVFQYVDE